MGLDVRGGCYAHYMSEACTEIDARLEAVANAAAPLPSRLPRVRDPALGLWMAHQMDVLLRNVTSGYGALDVAIGEGLEALNVGRRAMDLSTPTSATTPGKSSGSTRARR